MLCAWIGSCSWETPSGRVIQGGSRMIRRVLVGVGAIAMAVSFTASVARADIESRDLFWANSAISGSGTQPLDCSINPCANPAPYVNLTINLINSTTALVTFDAYPFYALGANSAADIDTNGAATMSVFGGTP